MYYPWRFAVATAVFSLAGFTIPTALHAATVKGALIKVSGAANAPNGNLDWRMVERNEDQSCSTTQILFYGQPYDNAPGGATPTTPEEICEDAATAMNGAVYQAQCVNTRPADPPEFFVRIATVVPPGKDFCVQIDGNTLIPGDALYNDAQGITLEGKGKPKLPEEQAGCCRLLNGAAIENSFEGECNLVGGVFSSDPGLCVPTMSEWGLIAMGLLTCSAATIVIMRRKALAA